MSDDAEQFFSAWTMVFSENSTQKLLCAWHIDRVWRQAIRNHIQVPQEQVEMYHHLQLLQSQRDITEFQLLLQKFLTLLLTKSHSFYEYFCTNYASRAQEWATCYRVGSPVNTNMFVEAFHRVLKIVVYLEHKQNRQLDVLINILMKVARDKIFERLLKREKGKQTHRVCDILKRHKTATDAATKTSAHPINDTKWKVHVYLHKEIRIYFT